MSDAWRDGYPSTGLPVAPGDGGAGSGTDDPYLRGYGYQPAGAPTGSGDNPAAQEGAKRKSLPDRATARVSRIRSFEGMRGRSTRQALAIKYVAYFLVILTVCGVTQSATDGVRYASGGGKFMLASCAVISVTGAVATLFYPNLRNEIVEKVRHYIFGIMLIPGALLALLLRALAQWEWTNEGNLGPTLQGALPAIFLATVVLPTLVFVKEMLGIRTLHRSKLDDQEAVQLWTRMDGLQK